MDQQLLPASDIKKLWADWALLLLIALACYWPFTFSVFSAKNDNIIAFLPLRYNISEAIRSGHFPFWSPYIYMGFPMHSDMQSGCWNPFVWMFSMFRRYDLTTLHMETLLYIFLSGTGMYRLLQTLQLKRTICVIGASAFMMSGFVTDVGGSNILFLAAAAFIPYVFNYYLLFLRSPGTKTAIKTSLALSLLFLTSYPSFFILTCYVLLAGLTTRLTSSFKKRETIPARIFFINHILMAISFLAICAPAIISYWELLPFYKRGASVSLTLSQQNNFHPASLAGILLPTAAIKDSGNNTDLICRNIYFNSFLFVFFVQLLLIRKTIFQYFLLGGLLFFLLFSFGEFTPVHGLSYQMLPLVNTFRHPANARLFGIIAMIILGCITMNNSNEERGNKSLKWIAVSLLVVCMGACIYAITGSALLTNISRLTYDAGNRLSFKAFLDSISFKDALLINGLLQMILIGLLIFFVVRKSRLTYSIALFALNSFLFAQMAIPFTFASKTNPAEINSMLHDFPKGFPLPDLSTSIQQNTLQTGEGYEKVGLVNFYNKRIGAPDKQVTPTFIHTYDSLLSNDTVRKIVFNNPVAFLADTLTETHETRLEQAILSTNDSGSKGNLRLLRFDNNHFEFEVESGEAKALCLQQVLLPNWKVYLDGNQTFAHRGNIAFMYTWVPPGKHKVQFVYWPAHIIYALILSIIAIVTSLVLLKWKNK